MNIDKILVVGCSFATGSGLAGEHNNPEIWPNQLSKKLGATYLKNAAKTGANNHWIFLEAMSQLIKENYDLVLVEWSAIPRYKLNVGLELYETNSMLDRNINLVSGETVSVHTLEKIKKLLLRLHNAHWDLLNLVKYVNILIEIQKKIKTKKHIFYKRYWSVA